MFCLSLSPSFLQTAKASHLQLQGSQVQLEPHLHPFSDPAAISRSSKYLWTKNHHTVNMKPKRNERDQSESTATDPFWGATPMIMVCAVLLLSSPRSVSFLHLHTPKTEKVNIFHTQHQTKNSFSSVPYPPQPLPQLQLDPHPQFPPLQDISLSSTKQSNTNRSLNWIGLFTGLGTSAQVPSRASHFIEPKTGHPPTTCPDRWHGNERRGATRPTTRPSPPIPTSVAETKSYIPGFVVPHALPPIE